MQRAQKLRDTRSSGKTGEKFNPTEMRKHADEAARYGLNTSSNVFSNSVSLAVADAEYLAVRSSL